MKPKMVISLQTCTFAALLFTSVAVMAESVDVTTEVTVAGDTYRTTTSYAGWRESIMPVVNAETAISITEKKGLVASNYIFTGAPREWPGAYTPQWPTFRPTNPPHFYRKELIRFLGLTWWDQWGNPVQGPATFELEWLLEDDGSIRQISLTPEMGVNQWGLEVWSPTIIDDPTHAHSGAIIWGGFGNEDPTAGLRAPWGDTDDLRYELQDEYTTAMLLTDAVAHPAVFRDVFTPLGDQSISFLYGLRSDEAAYNDAKAQFKFTWKLPAPAGGTNRVSWVVVYEPRDGGEKKYTSFQWEGQAAESPVQTYIPPAGQYGTYIITFFAPALAVDANRDGSIVLSNQGSGDLNPVSSPFRFWLNDDNDSGEEKSGSLDDLPVANGTGSRNCDDNQVNGVRDLVDFFPVCLDVKQLLTVLPPGTNGISYYLKQEDSALGIVFTSYTRAQAFDYLRGTPSSLDTGFGPTLTQKAGEATVTKVTATGVDLFATSPAFQARIQNNDDGVILVEASKATTKPWVLEVRKGTDVIATVQLAIKTDPVETMFRYYNIRSQAHGTAIAADNQGPNYGATTPSDAPNDPFQNVANRKNAVFVHGYNVNSKQAQGSAAEMFKRLYWGGSKAKFYAVLWRGDDGQGEGLAPAGATPDYHRNVGHAWQQGPYLRDLLTSLTGDTAVIAHSLGNMVTQVALTYERDPSNAARLRPAARPASVKNYFAIDAALPLEALDVASITASSKPLMRHPDWAEYDTQERLWPTQWYALFTGTSDGRNGLTWRNVFAGLDVGTNLYSSGEEVLSNPINDSVPLWEPLFGGGLRAWVSQEKHKGGAGPAAPFFRSWTGGWIENKAWYVPIVPTPPAGSPQTRPRFVSEAQDVAVPGGVPTSALPSEPFFQRFQSNESGGFYPGYQGSRLHAPIGDTNADDEARKLVTVAKCLGEAISALSFPQGSNASPAFTRPGMSGNFDLNTSTFKNGWPSSRSDTNWKHSDCLNVAYTFNFPLYDKMTNDGGLK